MRAYPASSLSELAEHELSSRRISTARGERFNESDEDSSSSDVSNSCPFKPEIAAKLTAAFAKATGIDFEFAVDLLNVHEWNIDQALAATYEAKERAQTMITTK